MFSTMYSRLNASQQYKNMQKSNMVLKFLKILALKMDCVDLKNLYAYYYVQ